MNEAKYQWSMSKPSGEILVVRSDDFNDFKLEVSVAKLWFEGHLHESPAKEVEPASEATTGAQSVCKEHNVEMKKNVNGKWYHREFEAGQGVRFCNGYTWSDWTK